MADPPSLYGAKPKGWIKVKAATNMESQTKEVVGEAGARVCAALDGARLKAFLYADAKTVYQAFRRGVREAGSGDCLGRRVINPDGSPGDFVWLSYQQVLARAENVGAGLSVRGLPVGQTAFVGLYSQNRPEWVIAEQGTYNHSRVVVPLYDTLGPDGVHYIITKTEMELIFVDTVAKASTLLNRKKELPSLRVLIVFDPITPALVQQGHKVGVKVMGMGDLEKEGSSTLKAHPDHPPAPEDLCTVCFTSGTTGNPKGVMLTHGNVVANTTLEVFYHSVKLTPHEVYLSFLPLAHMFERIVLTMMVSKGAKIAFFRGDIKLLGEDLRAARPTIIIVVPRLLNRIYDKVHEKVNESFFLKRWLFHYALGRKKEEAAAGIVRNDTVWDDLIFKNVRDGLGGRVKIMITGSAPVADHVLTFFRAATGAVVLQGYGQTENAAAATLTLEADFSNGHVGVPAPCCMIKLVDVPDMGYFAKEKKGEICIKGHNVAKGYFKEPEKTAETFVHGWLHTGDIGQWTEHGVLKCIDRKKNLFKLSQGEYIAPEKLENVYVMSKYVAQIFVHGEPLKSVLVGVVVADMEVVGPMAERDFGLKGKDAVAKDDRIKKLIMGDLDKVGKSQGLNHFEMLKDIHLHPELFSVENGLLTPTFKSKRPELRVFFKPHIDRMYAKLP